MADIFISYASEDRARAEKLAQALGARGWSIWWDREIPLGKSFDEVIEKALAEARCVIVLWSGFSIVSEWVRNEASEARTARYFDPGIYRSGGSTARISIVERSRFARLARRFGPRRVPASG